MDNGFQTQRDSEQKQVMMDVIRVTLDTVRNVLDEVREVRKEIKIAREELRKPETLRALRK